MVSYVARSSLLIHASYQYLDDLQVDTSRGKSSRATCYLQMKGVFYGSSQEPIATEVIKSMFGIEYEFHSWRQ